MNWRSFAGRFSSKATPSHYRSYSCHADRQRRTGAVDELLFALSEKSRRTQDDEPRAGNQEAARYDRPQHPDPDFHDEQEAVSSFTTTGST